MAEHVPTTPERRTAAPPAGAGRRGLFAGAAALLAAPALAAAAPAPDDSPLVTAEFLGTFEFEPMTGVREALGTRDEWMKRAGERYAVMLLAVASLERTPDELAEIYVQQQDASDTLIEYVSDLQERLQGEAKVLETVELRLLAGACRANLV